MRKRYAEKLKNFFRNKLLITRSELNLTQEEMSERLEISLRSYAELESGRSLLSSLTLVLFLIYSCPDIDTFINELREVCDLEIKDNRTNDNI